MRNCMFVFRYEKNSCKYNNFFQEIVCLNSGMTKTAANTITFYPNSQRIFSRFPGMIVIWHNNHERPYSMRQWRNSCPFDRSYTRPLYVKYFLNLHGKNSGSGTFRHWIFRRREYRAPEVFFLDLFYCSYVVSVCSSLRLR